MNTALDSRPAVSATTAYVPFYLTKKDYPAASPSLKNREWERFPSRRKNFAATVFL